THLRTIFNTYIPSHVFLTECVCIFRFTQQGGAGVTQDMSSSGPVRRGAHTLQSNIGVSGVGHSTNATHTHTHTHTRTHTDTHALLITHTHTQARKSGVYGQNLD